MVATTQWLVDQLLRSAKRRAYMPTADETFNTADMLEVINEEMASYVVPFMREVHEEYWVRRFDVVVAAGQADFRIPPRCAGEAMKGLLYDATGTGDYRPLTRVEPENAAIIGGPSYYLEDDRVVLNPLPVAAQSMRILYIQRPAKMVVAADCVQLTAISGVTLTPGASATVGSRITNGSLVDIVAGQPGFRTLALDLLATVAAGATMTLAVVAPTNTAVGDYVCVAGESCFPQVPPEVHPLLAQRAAAKMLEGKGGSNYQLVKDGLDELHALTMSALKDRTEIQAKYVHNFNAPGWRGTGYRPRNIP